LIYQKNSGAPVSSDLVEQHLHFGEIRGLVYPEEINQRFKDIYE